MKKENVYAIISKRIREERLKLGWTQEQVAEKANMEYKFLSSIERNVDKPSLDTFVRIANALNVSCDSLITGNKTDKDRIKGLVEQFRYLISDLDAKQQEQIMTFVKDAKKLLK